MQEVYRSNGGRLKTGDPATTPQNPLHYKQFTAIFAHVGRLTPGCPEPRGSNPVHSGSVND
jgi:hypothetical protein